MSAPSEHSSTTGHRYSFTRENVGVEERWSWTLPPARAEPAGPSSASWPGRQPTTATERGSTAEATLDPGATRWWPDAHPSVPSARATTPDGAQVADLIYAINASLDGYIEDAAGNFDWSEPGEDAHRFFNDLVARCGTQLLGRRMYETMAVWETDPSLAASSPVMAEFAEAWRDSDKVVCSATLAEPLTQRTRIATTFDPDEVRALKENGEGDILIGGPGLAGHAFREGLVDEVHIMVSPLVVGSGKPAFPTDVRTDFELAEEDRFEGGLVHLGYRVRT